MDNQGLLFIPDISGYTKFINNTEIEHSRFIIQELLEVLVNSNNIDLKISEIEGDAILFYRFGKPPSVEEMYQQVEKMFCNFHKYTRQYEDRRICPCKACEGVKDLTLKVITHHGEFSTYTVKEFSKLIGKDVIKAHQLLKNDIPLHEYWLVTNDIYKPDKKENLPEWLEWKEGKKQDENNEIDYHYSMLSPLRDKIPADTEDQFSIKGASKVVISAKKEFNENIDTMFRTVADFSARPQWMEGITAIDNVTTKIPQVGTAHNCIVGKKVNVLVTSSFKKDEKAITIEETDTKRMGTGQFILEKKGDNKTLMTFNFLLKKNPLLLTIFNLFMKKKLDKSINKSLDNLENYFKSQKKAA
jgi:carbon monoxide dehydrogenase subunit G